MISGGLTSYVHLWIILEDVVTLRKSRVITDYYQPDVQTPARTYNRCSLYH
jgi:hypothetical protein